MITNSPELVPMSSRQPQFIAVDHPSPSISVDAARRDGAGNQRFQFGMRSLLLGVTGCGIFFGTAKVVGPMWAMGIGWFVLLVVGHVTAAMWGLSSQRQYGRRESSPSSRRRDASLPVTSAPTTRLGGRAQLGWTPLVLTVAAAGTGGTLGTLLFYQTVPGIADLVLGGFSFTVLGGFFGFLASSFFQVSAGALSEAAAGGTPHRR